MVRTAGILLAAFLFIFAAQGKDLTDSRVGAVAQRDIAAPVPLDVVDPAATAALKAAEALKTPVIFRADPAAARRVEEEFRAAFAAARSKFLAALTHSFPAAPLDATTLASPDFEYFITAFNVQNKQFPLTAKLAAAWAQGNAGTAVEDKLLGSLRRLMAQPVRPDDLPAGLVLGDTARLVPAAASLTLDEAEGDGRIVPQADLVTLSQARAQFRGEFSPEEQLVARALAAFLQPNCRADERLARQARARQTAMLVVTTHYGAGQIIVRRGQTIDAKIQAALEQLYAKTAPGPLSRQIAPEREQAQSQVPQEQPQAQPASNPIQSEKEPARRAQTETRREQAMNAQSRARALRVRTGWLETALAGVCALAVLTLLGRARRRRRPSPLPASAEMKLWLARHGRRVSAPPEGATTMEMEHAEKNRPTLPDNLAPYLAQALKEAVVQELAAQRGELVRVQQLAAMEIAELVRRLDRLQAPMHERLHSYEMRISELEKELAERTEENRELLKMKIEMLRRQLESERSRNRVEFN
ncbi:MAG: hypothetical protein KGJ60_14715 [Verrucomicrobiota bacterium]|nr:hypothetical protein [Verrucomicrobiota bacterium]